MSLLATLRAKRLTRKVATLTTATDATQEDHEVPPVAKVATVTVASERQLQSRNNNFTKTANTNQQIWPNILAMSPNEVDTFSGRLARFTDKGLCLEDAERLADRLVQRDREADDRVLCLECNYLTGKRRWICGNWGQADVARESMAPSLVVTLQRCNGFIDTAPGAESTLTRCDEAAENRAVEVSPSLDAPPDADP